MFENEHKKGSYIRKMGGREEVFAVCMCVYISSAQNGTKNSGLTAWG